MDVPEDARRFLDIPFSGLLAPDLLPGVPEAADRLLAAARAGRCICIYGDYDVDGVTGTAILVQGFVRSTPRCISMFRTASKKAMG